jgi:hypothetical protein
MAETLGAPDQQSWRIPHLHREVSGFVRAETRFSRLDPSLFAWRQHSLRHHAADGLYVQPEQGSPCASGDRNPSVQGLLWRSVALCGQGLFLPRRLQRHDFSRCPDEG